MTENFYFYRITKNNDRVDRVNKNNKLIEKIPLYKNYNIRGNTMKKTNIM